MNEIDNAFSVSRIPDTLMRQSSIITYYKINYTRFNRFDTSHGFKNFPRDKSYILRWRYAAVVYKRSKHPKRVNQYP